MERKKLLFTAIFFILLLVLTSANDKPEVIWRFPTGGKIQTSPIQGSDGSVYFCSEDRFLYAVNSDGSLKWRTKFSDRLTGTLSLGIDGSIYIGSKKGLIFAVNASGDRIWTRKLKGPPFGSPAIAPDGTLFLATENGWMYAISHRGYVRWEVKLPSEPVMAPVLGKNIYIGLKNQRLYSYNRLGKNEWIFLLSGQAESIALSSKSIYVGTDNSTLVSIDYSGKRIWNQSLPGITTSVLVPSEDRVLSSSGSNLIMMNSTGEKVWIKTMGKRQIDLSVIADEIVSIDTAGSISWTNWEGTPISVIRGVIPGGHLLLASDGSVYIGGKDWILYKYAFKNIVQSNYNNFLWPSFRSDNGNRGYLDPGLNTWNEPPVIKSPDFIYLKEMSGSLDEKVLNNVLDEIESRMISRSYDAGKLYFINVLESLASEGIKNPLLENGVLVNNFPVIRSRAVELLGIMGNLSTIDFLSDLLLFEWDSYVANSIIKALGNLQSDWKNKNSTAIIKFFRMKNGNMSERTLSQILLTIKKINIYKGNSNRDLISVVMDILLSSNSKSVKEFALDIINSVKK